MRTFQEHERAAKEKCTTLPETWLMVLVFPRLWCLFLGFLPNMGFASYVLHEERNRLCISVKLKSCPPAHPHLGGAFTE